MDVDGNIIIGVEVDDTGLKEGIEKIEKTDVDTKFSGLNKVLGLIGGKLKGALSSMLGISKAVIGMIAKLGILGVLIAGLVFVAKIIGEAFQIATQENETLRVQLEYIKYAIHNIASLLAGTIGKLIAWIIDKVFKLLSLLGGVIKAITGVNIFSGVTADNFEKTQKSVGAIKKATGQIKKNLYGWDEMTRVEDMNAGGVLGGLGLSGDIQKAIDSLPDLENEVENMAKRIKNWFLGGYPDLKTALKNAPKDLKENFKKMFEPIYKTIVEPYLVNPIKQWAKDTEPVWRPIKEAFEKTIQEMKPIWQQFVDIVEPNVIKPIENSFDKFKTKFLKTFAPFINSIIDDINYVFGIFGVHLEHIDVGIEDTGKGIEKNVKKPVSEAIKDTSSLEKAILGLPKSHTTTINVKADTSKARKSLSDLIGDIGRAGIDGTLGIKNYLKSMSIIGARKGAIINMPGRGIPVSNVVGGEAGREGVIPLTDSQQMAMLGEAIGRYININATIPVYVGNRQVAREIRLIEQEEAFAGNR